MDCVSEIGDVSKQKDLSGFYRHLYRVTLGNDINKDASIPDADNLKKSSPNVEIETSTATVAEQKQHKRQYRNCLLYTSLLSLTTT